MVSGSSSKRHIVTTPLASVRPYPVMMVLKVRSRRVRWSCRQLGERQDDVAVFDGVSVSEAFAGELGELRDRARVQFHPFAGAGLSAGKL